MTPSGRPGWRPPDRYPVGPGDSGGRIACPEGLVQPGTANSRQVPGTPFSSCSPYDCTDHGDGAMYRSDDRCRAAESVRKMATGTVDPPEDNPAGALFRDRLDLGADVPDAATGIKK